MCGRYTTSSTMLIATPVEPISAIHNRMLIILKPEVESRKPPGVIS